MKNLFTYIIICLVGAVMFSSCTSHLTVTKRQHRNGYYIAFDRGLSGSSSMENKQGPVAMEEKNLPAETNNTITGEPDQASPVIPAAGVNELPVVSSSAKEPNASSPQKENRTGTLKKSLQKVKEHVLRKPREIKKITHSEDGYSLLWIVIVAILILWAISLLSDGFGLGGVIHVLLVIALILFILWLLHLI